MQKMRKLDIRNNTNLLAHYMALGKPPGDSETATLFASLKCPETKSIWITDTLDLRMIELDFRICIAYCLHA